MDQVNLAIDSNYLSNALYIGLYSVAIPSIAIEEHFKMKSPLTFLVFVITCSSFIEGMCV